MTNITEMLTTCVYGRPIYHGGERLHKSISQKFVIRDVKFFVNTEI